MDWSWSLCVKQKFALAYHMPKINFWIIVNRDMMNRADKLKSEVKALLTGLPAADAQYNKKCYDDFVCIP